MDKNKRYIFFIRAESHVKGMKISFEKNRFFFFQSEYRRNNER